MKGLQIWANSLCRSTLGFYGALGGRLGVPLRICLAKPGLGLRESIGFDQNEFSHLNLIELNGQSSNALDSLMAYKDWHQLFGVYQSQSHVQAALTKALQIGCRVGIASEAPKNMLPPSFKRGLKATYLSHFARHRFAHITQGADFILNWSGDDSAGLQKIGWAASKIIPLGYFPPPLEGSKFVKRDIGLQSPLHIVCSGAMTWHRGPDILIEALALLKAWGIQFTATLTGTGPLFEPLKAKAEALDLNCDFPGFVSLQELIELYQTCSVFCAPGREEPWGMRINDALNCGAPIVISRGMGAHKLVNDYGLGLTYAAEDPTDLAWQLRHLATDEGVYKRVCGNLEASRNQLLPDGAAMRAIMGLETCAPQWLPTEASSQGLRA